MRSCCASRKSGNYSALRASCNIWGLLMHSAAFAEGNAYCIDTSVADVEQRTDSPITCRSPAPAIPPRQQHSPSHHSGCSVYLDSTFTRHEAISIDFVEGCDTASPIIELYRPDSLKSLAY